MDSFWMDGRVAYTTGVPYGDGRGGGMAVQASYEGDADVILESAEVWELHSCWINETTALQMLEAHQQRHSAVDVHTQ